MEKKLRTKIDEYMLDFKKNIQTLINEKSIIDKNGTDVKNQIIEQIYDFKSIEINKDDFQKRKRTKNIIVSNCKSITYNFTRGAAGNRTLVQTYSL